jgi:hypothetical protein
MVFAGRTHDALYTFSHFRFVPDPALRWAVKESRSPDQATLEVVERELRLEIDVDLKTKLARKWLDDGRSMQWQGGFTEYKGGVTAPKFSCWLSFRNGNVYTLHAYQIENAEFNGPVQPTDLAIRVAAGTLVVDDRRPEARQMARVRKGGDAIRLADGINNTR